MFSYKRALGVVAGAAALAVTAAPSFAAMDKCSKLIDGESLKMQSGALKGFQKCQDAYRKDVLKPPTPKLSKAAAACEKELGKIIAAGGVIDKGVSKLAVSVPKTCVDSDLLALGHLPSGTFGTRWAQFQGIAALQYAYEQQVTTTRDWNLLLDLVGDTGSCPNCDKLKIAPCNDMASPLLQVNPPACNGSTACASVILEPINFQVPLTGTSVLKICDASTLLSSATGVLFVMGAPGKVLGPAPVGTIRTACTRSNGAEGLIQCGAGAQKINYATCIDHTPAAANDAGSTSSGACTGDVCNRTEPNGEAGIVDPDEPLDKLNGGQCYDFTAVGGAAGDAFVMFASTIDLRPPGDDCTNPSTSVNDNGTPSNTPLTTGSASAKVLNADGTPGAEINSDPATGAAFNCTQIAAGRSPGVRLVGAFGAVNTLEVAPGAILDSVTGFQLAGE